MGLSFSYMGRSRGTGTKSWKKKCKVIMVLPYIEKYTLLRIVVLYFWILLLILVELCVLNLTKKTPASSSWRVYPKRNN